MTPSNSTWTVFTVPVAPLTVMVEVTPEEGLLAVNDAPVVLVKVVCARAVAGKSRAARARTNRLNVTRVNRTGNTERASNDIMKASHPLVGSCGEPLGKGEIV